MEKLEIKVKGMMCEGCENRIKNALFTIDGVESHSGYLSDEEVRTKVLNHAQVTLNDLKSYEDELDVKNNQLVYNVNFTDAYASYNYQVNAISGEIVSFDVKM